MNFIGGAEIQRGQWLLMPLRCFAWLGLRGKSGGGPPHSKTLARRSTTPSLIPATEFLKMPRCLPKKELVHTIIFPGHKTVSGVVLCLSLAGLVGRLEMKVYWQKDEGVTGRPVGPPDWP